MSEMIVQVRNKMLRRIGGVNHFVSHNKDYTIQFQFDESWDNVRTKMAVFAYEDGEYGSEIFDGDTCNVPELPREGRILIGVKAGEDLSTELLCIPVCKSADDVITDEYDEPDPKIYEQILDIINNLWNGGTTVYPSPVKFLASPSAAKVGDLIRVKEVDENGDVTRTEGFDVGVELEKKINAPQVAQVGEVLTVEEVDADGKPKKWKTQTVETAHPDWMENVSNNPGFVKNRTHYKQIVNGPGNPGYKVNLLDGTHRVGDIILLQSVTTNSLQKILMRGINSPDWDIYELCMLIKETDNNDKTYNLEVICKDRENIVEVNTLSEGNMKVLYSEQKKALLAYYFISNLSTLSTDDKTKFTQTGVYVQLAGNDYSEYAELWATYRLYLYTKLSNKYLNIRQDPPDWNENDPTKPGYIKNRTHYDSRHAVELFNTTVENTSLPFIKVADADIDVTKIDRVKMNVQIPASDGSVRTIEFDSDGGEITQNDVNGDGSQIDTTIKKTTGNVTEQYILPYFKTNEVADECTGTTGIYTAGLYMLSEREIIKGTFVGFGNAGELKTIDPKFIPLQLPYIIQKKKDGNVKIELPYEFVVGEKYRVVYTDSMGKKIDELTGVYSNNLGKVGIFQSGEEYADNNVNSNAYYILSGSDSMWINEYWERSMSPVFDGVYRVVEPGYSIPYYAIDGLEQSINAEIDRFETKYDRKMLEEVGDWKYMGFKKITSDTNEINTTTLFGGSYFSNIGKILVKLDLIITNSQSVDTTINFMFGGRIMGTAPVVSSSTNKKTYWFYATEIYNNVLCILFEGDSYYDYGDINIKSMTWFNSEAIQYIKISTGNPGYNVIAKNTKVTIFKAKR